MPRDPRTYITVHDGMPEHPKVEPLSDAAFRLLITSWQQSRDGRVKPSESATFAELVAAELVTTDGDLREWGALFRGPFRERTSRPKISPLTREIVYARDLFRCVTCGTDQDLSLDHIYPWSLGGDSSEGNLQTMCKPCNSRKGAKVDA